MAIVKEEEYCKEIVLLVIGKVRSSTPCFPSCGWHLALNKIIIIHSPSICLCDRPTPPSFRHKSFIGNRSFIKRKEPSLVAS